MRIMTYPRHIISAVLIVLLSVLSWTRSGIYTTQMRLWKDTVERSPNKARPHTNFGSVLKGLGDWEGAFHHFERAYELQPDNPNVLNNLATMYSARGKKTEAIKLLEKAVAYEPLHKDARYNLALLYYQLGLVEEAKQQYVLIDQYWPNSSEALFARRMLAMIRDGK